jgi:hypothetical protein
MHQTHGLVHRRDAPETCWGRRSLILALVLSPALATSVSAQTNDALFRSWRWEPLASMTPRVAGAAGALALLTDDFNAAMLNPAGIVRCARFLEGGGGFFYRDPAPAGDDELPRGNGFTPPIGAVYRRGCSWAGGAYYVRTAKPGIRLGSAPLPNGSWQKGSLWTAQLQGSGAAFGVRVHPRWSLGGNVELTWLTLDANYSTFSPAGVKTLQVEIQDSAMAIGLTVGTIVDVTDRLRSGAAFRHRAPWSLARRATSELGRSGATFKVREPDALSVAVAWDVFLGHGRRWLTLAGQGDRVFYSQVRSTLAVPRGNFAAADYRLDDAWEGHLGVEWTIPTRCWSGCGALVQLRGGAHRQAGGMLRYVGADGSEAALFPGAADRWLFGLGGSVGFKAFLPWRFDASINFGPHSPTTLLLGVAARYGITFADAGVR